MCVSGIKWIGWVFSLALVIFHAGFAARHPDGNTPLCPCWTQHLPPVLRLTPLAACGILFVNLFSFCVENKVFVVYFLFWRFFLHKNFCKGRCQSILNMCVRSHILTLPHTLTLSCRSQFPCIYYENTLKVNFLNALVAFTSLSAWRFTIFTFSLFSFFANAPFSRGDCRVRQPLWPVC